MQCGDYQHSVIIVSVSSGPLQTASLWVRLSMYLMASRMMSSCVTFSFMQRLGSSWCSLECNNTQHQTIRPDSLCLYLPAQFRFLCENLLLGQAVYDRGLSGLLILLIVSISEHDHREGVSCGLCDDQDWTEVRAECLYCYTATSHSQATPVSNISCLTPLTSLTLYVLLSLSYDIWCLITQLYLTSHTSRLRVMSHIKFSHLISLQICLVTSLVIFIFHKIRIKAKIPLVDPFN